MIDEYKIGDRVELLATLEGFTKHKKYTVVSIRPTPAGMGTGHPQLLYVKNDKRELTRVSGCHFAPKLVRKPTDQSISMMTPHYAYNATSILEECRDGKINVFTALGKMVDLANYYEARVNVEENQAVVLKDERDALKSMITTKDETLKELYSVFVLYHQLHMDKSPPDTEKAARNLEYAAKAKEALGINI